MCTEKKLWSSFSKAKVKVMLVKVKNDSDEVQVKLRDSLQETFCYRQDVGILPYKQLRVQNFSCTIKYAILLLILLNGSEFYSLSLFFLPHLDDPAQYPLLGEELCLHLK